MGEAREADCPHCGQQYQASAAEWPRFRGRAVRCDACNRRFIVRPARRRPPREEDEGAAQPSPGDLPPRLPPLLADFPDAAAIAALLLGLGAFFLPVVLSTAAVLCGVAALSRRATTGSAVRRCHPRAHPRPRKLHARARILSNHRDGTRAGRQRRRAENMRRIAAAIRTYAQFDRAGAFPDSLGSLVLSEGVASADFVCPATSDTPAPGATVGERIAGLAGGHLSYHYAGNGLKLTSSASEIVLYESLENHGDGSNVLFADGHVAFVPKENVPAILDNVKASKWGRAGE